MISAKTIAALEAPDNQTSYILGARMRKVELIRDRVLSHPGSYRQVHPESSDPEKPAPLKVKQVELDGGRYIVCVNARQQRKDASDRQAIVDALAAQIKKGPKSLVGKQGFSQIPENRKGQRQYR